MLNFDMKDENGTYLYLLDLWYMIERVTAGWCVSINNHD